MASDYGTNFTGVRGTQAEELIHRQTNRQSDTQAGIQAHVCCICVLEYRSFLQMTYYLSTVDEMLAMVYACTRV